MTIINTKKDLRPREKNDFYPTPIELCEAALRQSQVKLKNPRILDPGCGDGPWGDAAYGQWPGAHITGVDIRENISANYNAVLINNFLTMDFNRYFVTKSYDLIIGNPPYNQAEKFIRKCYDLLNTDGEIIFLLRLSFMEGQKRGANLFRAMPPRDVYVSTRRVSFTGDRKSDDTAYGIYIWQKNNPINFTVLRWMAWEYEDKE